MAQGNGSSIEVFYCSVPGNLRTLLMEDDPFLDISSTDYIDLQIYQFTQASGFWYVGLWEFRDEAKIITDLIMVL